MIRILTYNLSWESLESVDSKRLDMSHCNQNRENICRNNIAQIIHQMAWNNPYDRVFSNQNNITPIDFIFLQEVNSGSNQWTSLKNSLQIIDPNFLSNYQTIMTLVKPAGIITLFDKSKYNLISKIEGNLTDNSDARPFHILVFKENIICINIHMPHTNKKQDEAFDIIKNNLEKLKDLDLKKFRFFIGGDFNNSEPEKLNGFKNLLKIFGKQFYPEKQKILSCCVPKDINFYTKSYDHIYDSESEPIIYETIPDIKKYLDSDKNILMSDHLPIYGVYGSNNKNQINPIFHIYKINYDNL